jgi:hypothetical protein
MISTMIEDHLEDAGAATGPLPCRPAAPPSERLIAESALVRTRAA